MESRCLLLMAATFLGCSTPVPSKPPLPPLATPAPFKFVVSGIFKIEFRHLQKDRFSDPQVPGAAFVTIIKNDGIAGEVTWSAIHEEGDILGRPRRQVGTSTLHKVFSSSKRQFFDVDFDTGITLLEITPNQVVASHTMHGWTSFTADEFILQWPNGTWEAYHLGPEAEKIGSGRVFPRGERVGESVAWILSLADDGWMSRNPKVRRESQELYRRLMKEHPKSPEVVKHFDRINDRAKAVLD